MLFSVLSSGIASGKKIETHSIVLLLDADNIDQALKEHQHILVNFYAPHCKKCSNILKGEWGAAAMELEQQAAYLSKVRMGKVDISKGNNAKLVNRFKLCEFPSFKLFENQWKSMKLIENL